MSTDTAVVDITDPAQVASARQRRDAKRAAALAEAAAPSSSSSLSVVDALSDALSDDDSRPVVMIPVEQIEPHPGNPRRDVGDISELTEDIAARGVDSPLTVVPSPEPAGPVLWRAVIGHRRLAASIAAGRDKVPCLIRSLSESEQRAMMVRENVHRADLTPVEEADAYQQMLDLDGLDVAAIAAAAGRSQTTVRSRLRLRTLPAAATARVHQHQATLADAERLLDFVDHPEQLERLTERLGHRDFAHFAQQAAYEVARATRAAEIRAELEAQGVRVIDEPHYDDTKVLALTRLTDTGEQFGASLKPAKHASCPGHVAWAGGYHPDHMGPVYGCDGWRRNGHHDRHSSTAAHAGPLTDEEKAERRRLVENNKAATASATVRRDWLVQFLARPKPPADAPVYVARVLVERPDRHYKEAEYLRDILALDKHAATIAYATDADPRFETPAGATTYLIALAASRVEAAMPKDYWRNPDRAIAAHLTALASWGYPLSELEQGYVGAPAEQGGER